MAQGGAQAALAAIRGQLPTTAPPGGAISSGAIRPETERHPRAYARFRVRGPYSEIEGTPAAPGKPVPFLAFQF